MVSEKPALDPEVRRALSNFYREEFVRHLEHLQCSGMIHDGNREAIQRACERLVFDLDRVCCWSDFPTVAETILQSFETLTRLSEFDPRQGH